MTLAKKVCQSRSLQVRQTTGSPIISCPCLVLLSSSCPLLVLLLSSSFSAEHEPATAAPQSVRYTYREVCCRTRALGVGAKRLWRVTGGRWIAWPGWSPSVVGNRISEAESSSAVESISCRYTLGGWRPYRCNHGGRYDHIARGLVEGYSVLRNAWHSVCMDRERTVNDFLGLSDATVDQTRAAPMVYLRPFAHLRWLGHFRHSLARHLFQDQVTHRALRLRMLTFKSKALLFSPNSVSTLRGSYGSKGPGSITVRSYHHHHYHHHHHHHHHYHHSPELSASRSLDLLLLHP